MGLEDHLSLLNHAIVDFACDVCGFRWMHDDRVKVAEWKLTGVLGEHTDMRDLSKRCNGPVRRIGKPLETRKLKSTRIECGGCAYLIDDKGDPIEGTAFQGPGFKDSDPLTFCNRCRRVVARILDDDAGEHREG